MDAYDNTGDKYETILDEMYCLTIKFSEDSMCLAAISLPAPAQARRTRVWIVDEDELEHLHHVFADMSCLQNHDSEIDGHETIMFASPQYLHREERYPGENGAKGNSPQCPMQPDAD